MYRLSYFTEEDTGKVLQFMRDNSFAIITGFGDGYPVATHVPLNIEVDESNISLTGHIMKNSDHHKAFAKNENVLVIFNGANCYISAGWYPNPVQASTWNYISVHAKGKIIFKDEAATKQIVENITNKYEGLNKASSFNNLPDEYVERLVKAIIGFTIKVENVENVFKLSQNHEQETRERIIKNLNQHGSDNERKIAEQMQQRINIPKRNR